MESPGYDADGQRKAGQLAAGLEELLPGRPRQWFIERNGCVRDLLHVLTGYGQDWAGKTALLAFDCGLAALRARVIGLLGAVVTAPWWPPFRVHRFVYRAWLRGKRARIPLSYRWEEALARPLEHIRYELPSSLRGSPTRDLARGPQHRPWSYGAPSN
jgi:ubiquinone biosynthesis protein COQ4